MTSKLIDESAPQVAENCCKKPLLKTRCAVKVSDVTSSDHDYSLVLNDHTQIEHFR